MLISCIRAIAYTHELLAILGQLLVRAFLARLQGHVSAYGLHRPAPGHPLAADSAWPWTSGTRGRRVTFGRHGDRIVSHRER